MPPELRMPGATLATRLKLYDTPGPDGERGGTLNRYFDPATLALEGKIMTPAHEVV
jgi:hypothetical protein